MSLKRWLIACLLAGLIPMASPADAITVSPMNIEMISVGPRSHALVSVVNDSDLPLPIEAALSVLTLDENGKARGKGAASDDFLIMPPQALIPPGATQNFRVQWLGDPAMEGSKSYLLYLNQIPVKQPKGQSGVQVVVSMGVMINVAPAKGEPHLKVVATSVATDKSGRRIPVITVENTSRVHALLPKATIHLASGSWTSTLTPRAIGDRIGIGLVQPGKRRRFKLPVALPASVGRVRADVELPQARR
jgi:fimbrial chaperone protein